MVVPMIPFDILLPILEYLPLPDPSPLLRHDFQDSQRNTRNALFCCSLASRELSQVAGRVLYRSVELNFRAKKNLYQTDAESSWTNQKGKLAFHDDEADLNEYGLPAAPHPLLSALDLKSLNATYTYVQNLHITGYLSTLPPGPTNQLPALLADAIHLFSRGYQAKLQSLRFTPESCHPQTFVQSLEVLSKLSEYFLGSTVPQPLCELHLNHHAFDDENKTRLLAQVRGLKKLTFENSTRVLLQALVGNDKEGNETSNKGWLCSLQKDLIELHFTNNCGSITPGVLNSFIPYLPHLECFTLGISYSLADKDVFTALAKLNKLKSVGVRWYLQLNSPPPSVFIEEWPLPALKVLNVWYSSRSLQAALPRGIVRSNRPPHTHENMRLRARTEPDEVFDDAYDADDSCPLCAWVTKVTDGSPALREVILIDEDEDRDEEVDETSDTDEIEEEDEVQAKVEADRVMWMMRQGTNFGESIIEEAEEDQEGELDLAEQ
ncbi:hypothetical protein F5050DRAFT_1806777 [Lentinula boryana]|uniref:F-box domain-containing protein n=1 Tax=Lentinula boryana TaxID=40481 RepID=A0ABQ8QFZ2_9AGAR|nr:hypothetical protein F5050DRAFT_1806777 [Lentinula boryana]